MDKSKLDNYYLLWGDKPLGDASFLPADIARFGKPIHKNKSKQRRARRKSQRNNR